MTTEGKQYPGVVRIEDAGRFSKARLVPPSPSGFVVLLAEIDRRAGPACALESGTRRRLLRSAKAAAAALDDQAGVRQASVFSAIIAPPGGHGAYLGRHPEVHRAAFDLAVLIETASPAAAEALRRHPAIAALEGELRRAARHVEVFTAGNIRSMGPVRHGKGGVFLFNFFHADRFEQNLGVWEYTAGWFQDETGLDNSCVLLPEPGAATDYTIINHCRWDRLTDVLPALLLKPSFRRYVLAHFEANHTAPMPILYRQV